jgi:hypothetical protein
MKLKTIAAMTVVAALAFPGAASAHTPNQSWFERHADQAAYDYAHIGDWYEGELGTSTNPTYSRGQRHYHSWNVTLYRMSKSKTKLCWKHAVLHWRGFDHTLGRALNHGCENPRELSPDQWAELDLGDFIAVL